jgi:ribosomal protein S18 acetylase RimI-like enzyme
VGNITTLPACRGQGLGTAITARVCRELLKTTGTIGLNVRADNAPAIHCYRKLGFEQVAEYEEWMVERK